MSSFPSPAVFSFGSGNADGDGTMKDTLGGKGAGLAEMTRLGIPVPPGFTISTAVCNFYYNHSDQYPGPLTDAVERALALLEERMDAGFGDPSRPLLVSVRSGSKFSMPGMMDTVLNLGLNRETLQGLHARAASRRFGLDCYRRLIEMYGNVVCHVEHHRFATALDEVKRAAAVEHDHQLSDAQFDEVIRRYEAIYESRMGKPFPQDPREQLWGGINAVFESWMTPRAVTYRRIHNIPHDLGTAVNVQAMVFGNLGETSATGVAFTRDPATGAALFYGEFLRNAQGEDVVAGIRTPQALRKTAAADGSSFEEQFPDCYQQLCEVRRNLEQHYGDMQDLEFTVQEGRLFLLQTRAGKRTGLAAIHIATDMRDEGIVDQKRAVRQVDPEGLGQVLAPTFAPADLEAAAGRRLARGLAAGPGAATGRIALSADRSVAMRAESDEPVILVRRETSPEDIAGMEAAAGILTARGGMTSHAAVVARGMGKPCVVGCEAVHIDEEAGTVISAGHTLREGDPIAVDGSTGDVYAGAIGTQSSEALRVITGELPAADSELFQRFERFLTWADAERVLGVRTNADTPEDARVARALGAEGIGLCRTEHMFFGKERILAFRRMILAKDEAGRRAALDLLLPFQRQDFSGIFEAMDGLPVTIRLLDPPLHEFLPHSEQDIARFAKEAGLPIDEVRSKVDECHEMNPMLGLRGCRLGLMHPEIYEMQVRAIIEAALDNKARGLNPVPEIMIPLTAVNTETDTLHELLDEVAREVIAARGAEAGAIDYQFGTMIEIPRAALTADQVARNLDFFSFGTNDLTQMTFGMSRDDTGALLSRYVKTGILSADPFVTLDQKGVGLLIEIAVEKGRREQPKLKIGICGEHGGDPESVAFCHRTGFDYVSCSPYRVPIARLAAARAALEG